MCRCWPLNIGLWCIKVHTSDWNVSRASSNAIFSDKGVEIWGLLPIRVLEDVTAVYISMFGGVVSNFQVFGLCISGVFEG